MPNNLSYFVSPPNGGKVSGTGGVLLITPNVPPQPDTGQLPTQPGEILYDIAKWTVNLGFDPLPLAKSGMLGAMAFRQVGYTSTFEFDIILDIRRQVELSTRGIAGATIFFQEYEGDLTDLIYSDEEGTIGNVVFDRYYWCPTCLLSTVSPVVNPNGKKMCRQHVEGVCSGHILLIPEYGSTLDISTIAGAYNRYLTVNPGVGS